MNDLDPMILSSLTPAQRRHRRRKGLDSARGQRRAVRRWHLAVKTDAGRRHIVNSLQGWEDRPGELAGLVAGSGTSSDANREAVRTAVAALRSQLGTNRVSRRAKAKKGQR